MNTQLVDSLVQVIQALSDTERFALEEKLFFDASYPKNADLSAIAIRGGSFDFLETEPDLYSLEDGVAINAVE